MKYIIIAICSIYMNTGFSGQIGNGSNPKVAKDHNKNYNALESIKNIGIFKIFLENQRNKHRINLRPYKDNQLVLEKEPGAF